MLGIIVALESEVMNINNHLTNPKKITINGFNGYLFSLLDKPIVLIFSGVGKSNAAAATISLINNFNVNTIINIGSCGSISKDISPNTVVVPSATQYIDVDATGFGYKENQVPHESHRFITSSDINKIINEVVQEYKIKQAKGILGTSDSFVNTKNINNFNIEQVQIVDMEGTAINQICNKCNVNFSCIKFVSDSIFDDCSNEEQWKKNINKNNLITDLLFNVCYKYIYTFNLNK